MELCGKPVINWAMVFDILDNLGESSFCGLGASVPLPIMSFIRNVLPRFREEYGWACSGVEGIMISSV